MPPCYLAVVHYSDVLLSVLEVADVVLVDCLEVLFIRRSHNHVVIEVVFTDLLTLVYAPFVYYIYLERYVQESK